MKLINDWRRAWRLFSMQALIVIGGLQGIIAALTPAALATTVLGTSVTWGALGTALTVAVAVLGALGRLIDQTPPAE